MSCIATARFVGAASVLLAATVLFAGEVSFAAESGSPAQVELRARSLFESALELQRQGELERACAAFEASAELLPAPHALLQVGNCRERRDPVGALQSFEAARVAAREETDPIRRQAYERAANDRIEPLRARVPTLTFWSSPTPGARASVAPQPAGAPQLVTSYGVPLRFNPGTYLVRVTAPGRETFVTQVSLHPEQRLALDLPPLVALPAAGVSPPPRRVASPAPPALERSPVGAPAPADPERDPERDAAGLRFGVMPVVLASTGTALLATSVVTGRVSSSARGELEAECAPADSETGLRACSPALADERRRVEDYARITDALWIGGAVLVGAGVTWFLFDQQAPDSPRLESGCSLAGCGVTLQGSF